MTAEEMTVMTLQVRRSTYHEVLKMNEAQQLLDVTGRCLLHS
jgi:hypothetical protein